jgi:hypothetical protein
MGCHISAPHQSIRSARKSARGSGLRHREGGHPLRRLRLRGDAVAGLRHLPDLGEFDVAVALGEPFDYLRNEEELGSALRGVANFLARAPSPDLARYSGSSLTHDMDTDPGMASSRHHHGPHDIGVRKRCGQSRPAVRHIGPSGGHAHSAFHRPGQSGRRPGDVRPHRRGDRRSPLTRRTSGRDGSARFRGLRDHGPDVPGRPCVDPRTGDSGRTLRVGHRIVLPRDDGGGTRPGRGRAVAARQCPSAHRGERRDGRRSGVFRHDGRATRHRMGLGGQRRILPGQRRPDPLVGVHREGAHSRRARLARPARRMA